MGAAPTLQDCLAAFPESVILDNLMADMANPPDGSPPVNAVGFGPFSVNAALTQLDARTQAQAQQMRTQVVLGQFLYTAAQLADPRWIRRIAKGFFQIDWIQASTAVWNFTLTNNSVAGPYTIKPRQLTVAAGGILFTNTTTVTLLAGAGHTVLATFAAVVPGTTGNIANNSSLRFSAGGLPGVAVTNPPGSLAAAAVNDEANLALLQRCISRWGTLGYGGTSSAYLYLVSQAAPSVTRVAVRDDNPGGAGTVWLFLANAAGPASDTELGLVRNYLAPRKALGQPLPQVFASALKLIPVEATIYTDGTVPLTGPSSPVAIASASLNFLASQFVAPGVLDLALIESVLRGGAFPQYGTSSTGGPLNVPGFSGVMNVALANPTADVVVGVDATPVFFLTLVNL